MKKTTTPYYHQPIKSKIMIKKFIFFLIAIIFATGNLISQGGQVHVNREWRDFTGNPVFNPILNPFGLEWTKSIPSASAGLITVGHTQVTGQGENILVTKYNDGGSILWQSNYNTSGTQNDYGIDLIEDTNNGDVYIVGTTDNGGTTDYDVVVLVYNTSGVLQYSTSYDANGLNDIGTAINFDSNGYPIVCASSESSGTMSDFLLLCYDPTLSLQWTPTTYDYASLIDVPVGIESVGGKIRIAGASANSLTDWDYTVAEFDEANGSYLGDMRDNISGVGYDQPMAFVKDASNNTYVTGRASSDGINYDIRTMKINANNTIDWTQTFDGHGLEDVGNTIAVDGNGDVIVGGYSTKTNNKKELICLKYDASGSLLWKHTQSSKDGNADAYIKAITLNNTNNHIYFIAGEKGVGANKEALVGKIKSNGEKSWEKSIKGGYDYLPSDIQFGGYGSSGIFTIAIKDSTINVYETAMYTELEMDTNRIYNNNTGKPICKQNELIVRFQASSINTSAIDNQIGTKVMEFGDLSDFLTASAYTTVINAFSKYCDGLCDIKAVKIFKYLPSTYTVATSRLGESIRVPDFWATLVLKFPSNITIKQADTVFYNLPSVVAYAHPNYVGETATPPNDSLWTQQKSLYPHVLYPNAHINVEEAWSIVTTGGLPFVKGGVFDTGVNWEHKDFGYDGVNPSSSKIKGWDFSTNSDVKTVPGGGDSFDHGTPCAGIIGAIKNNVKGIAGIAGGNYTGSPGFSDKGVSLYSMKLMNPTLFNSTVNYLADAITTSALQDSTVSPYAYGLHFMNNSWVIQETGGSAFWYTDTNIVLLNEAVHFINRLNVTFVAARGNLGYNSSSYPANTDDDWVLCVGGTGIDGKYIHVTLASPNGEFDACYGGGIDIGAPASHSLNMTTRKNGGWGSFNGTSSAAPHASGVVGLLMSYMNNPNGTDDYKNLAPEDCEFIIQKSATDVDSTNYDVLSGHGRLNAGKALRMVEKPYYALYHFGTNSSSSYAISKAVYSSIDTIKLTEKYQNQALVQAWFNKGKYIVKTYEISATVNHSFPFSTDSLMYYWPRPSSSAVLELFKGTNKSLQPRQRIIINSCSASSASLKGYIYQVKDTLGNPLGWWPCDTSLSCPDLGSLFEYSILVKNKAVGISELIKGFINVNLFPNPSNSAQTIEIQTEKSSKITIQLFDLMGRFIQNVYSGQSTMGKNLIVNDVSTLPNSMYIYVIKIDEQIINKKFVKQ
ncbi:MAG: S8 family serine peptidase [Bacteroidota bacterium]|nr:S8 family serine peptidase [Bacteroidota bacterium]MDP3146536.1 S8 family serine peptidase [Bacteroidota bacterium]MDP3555735.1 S8 family serine peptidase [Bacteroidota bacterium]